MYLPARQSSRGRAPRGAPQSPYFGTRLGRGLARPLAFPIEAQHSRLCDVQAQTRGKLPRSKGKPRCLFKMKMHMKRPVVAVLVPPAAAGAPWVSHRDEALVAPAVTAAAAAARPCRGSQQAGSAAAGASSPHGGTRSALQRAPAVTTKHHNRCEVPTSKVLRMRKA